jgi:hypothetical protein
MRPVGTQFPLAHFEVREGKIVATELSLMQKVAADADDAIPTAMRSAANHALFRIDTPLWFAKKSDMIKARQSQNVNIKRRPY